MMRNGSNNMQGKIYFIRQVVAWYMINAGLIEGV